MQPEPHAPPLANALAAGFTGIVVAAVAWLTAAPFIVPPLGATIFLCFVAPRAATSSPRHVLLGHFIGISCGWAALTVTGALGRPSAMAGGCQPCHVLAIGLALLGTIYLTQVLHAGHPPAGAMTVLVALGLVQTPLQFLAAEGGAAIIVGCAWLLHARRGDVNYPHWRHADPN
jgi:CBS domain-containing membrane protein